MHAVLETAHCGEAHSSLTVFFWDPGRPLIGMIPGSPLISGSFYLRVDLHPFLPYPIS